MKKPTPNFSCIFLRQRRRRKSSSFSSGEGRSWCSVATDDGKLTPSCHRHSVGAGKIVFITIYNNITISIIITTSEIDIIPLAVCVDQIARSSLLNLVHVCAQGFKIILCWLLKLYFLIVLYPLFHWPFPWFIVVSSSLCPEGLGWLNYGFYIICIE
jgi:hypothetical protein